MSNLFAWTAILAFGAASLPVAGEDHPLRILPAASGNKSWNDAGWQDEGGVPAAWRDWAIASQNYNLTLPSGETVKVYGFQLSYSGRFLNSNSAQVTIELGAAGIVEKTGMSSGGSYSLRGSGLCVDLCSDQTWSSDPHKSTGDFSVRLQNGAKLSSSTASTLTLADRTRLEVGVQDDFAGSIVVQDRAALWVTNGATIGAACVTLKGADAQLVFDGATATVAHRLVLADGAGLTMSGQLWTSSGLSVSGAATSVLAGTLLVPHGTVLEVEVAEGATLRVEGSVVDDETGLPVPIVKTGAGTLIAPRVVGDAEITGDFVLNDGAVALVCGNGLGAKATVKLNGGQLRFFGDFTVAADVEVRAASRITVDTGKTGTISGALLSTFNDGTDANLLTIDGAGLKVFSGGATFAAKALFEQTEGSILVRDVDWTLNGEGTYKMSAAADCFSISNATVKLVYDETEQKTAVFDVAVQGSAKGTLEICKGGVVEVGHAGHIWLGEAAQTHGRLLLSGGRYCETRTDRALAYIVTGLYGNSSGIIELEAGSFEAISAPRSGSGVGTFKWHGGVWRLVSNSCEGLIGCAQVSGNKASNLSMTLDGPECVLSYEMPSFAPDGKVVSTVSSTLLDASQTTVSPWTCEGSGCLTVTNATLGTKTFGLEIRAPFTNMNLCVSERIKVSFANDCPVAASLNNYVIGPGSLSYDQVFAEGIEPFPLVGVSVLAGGSFDLAEGVRLGIENLAYATDSTLVSAVPNATFSLTGVLTLPAVGETLNYSLARGYRAGNLVTAAGGVVGMPDFAPVDGSKKVAFQVGQTALSFTTSGLVLIFR